jgi:Lar family restriction alleviation protein
MTEQAQNLLPCPFCGSNRVAVHFKRAARKEGYQAMCLNCKVGQTHVMHSTVERSAAAWNARAPVTAADGCSLSQLFVRPANHQVPA